MRFEEAYEGWSAGRLTQAAAAQILGMCERSFRRYLCRYEADGLEGLVDRRCLDMQTQHRMSWALTAPAAHHASQQCRHPVIRTGMPGSHRA